MLSKTMQDAINAQIHHELFSSYLYLSMSAYCESVGLGGAAKWLHAQSLEENGHAMKLYSYVHSQNGRVILQGIETPKAEFGKLLDVFTEVLAHEQKVSASITNLYEISVKEKDYPTQFMLQWFVTEQVEEEKNATDIIEELKMVGDAPVPVMMIDRHLGMRAGK